MTTRRNTTPEDDEEEGYLPRHSVLRDRILNNPDYKRPPKKRYAPPAEALMYSVDELLTWDPGMYFGWKMNYCGMEGKFLELKHACEYIMLQLTERFNPEEGDLRRYHVDVKEAAPDGNIAQFCRDNYELRNLDIYMDPAVRTMAVRGIALPARGLDGLAVLSPKFTREKRTPILINYLNDLRAAWVEGRSTHK